MNDHLDQSLRKEPFYLTLVFSSTSDCVSESVFAMVSIINSKYWVCLTVGYVDSCLTLVRNYILKLTKLVDSMRYVFPSSELHMSSNSFISLYILINTESFFENMFVFLNVHISKICITYKLMQSLKQKLLFELQDSLNLLNLCSYILLRKPTLNKTQKRTAEI